MHRTVSKLSTRWTGHASAFYKYYWVWSQWNITGR